MLRYQPGHPDANEDGYVAYPNINSVEEAMAYGNRVIDSARFNIPANDAGFPAISLPAGFTTNKLPIGIHLHASYGREDLLLQVAAQLEKAKPEWFNQIAPLNVSNLR